MALNGQKSVPKINTATRLLARLLGWNDVTALGPRFRKRRPANTPHYGKQAAERNRRHRAAGTHGL